MPLQEEKVELLRQVNIFSQFREYELDQIAGYSEFVKYDRGERIFEKGDNADALYVVESGRVGIISFEKDDVVVAQITSRESFGELDFFGKSDRNAAAFSEVDSVLLRFPARHIASDSIFNQHAFVSARMLYRLLGIISERIWSVHKLLFEKSEWLNDLHKQLLNDKMTGLYNQNYLKEDFIRLLPDLGENAALLMIKPDNFKEINDNFSHEAGDKVLNMMAIFLQSELNEHDIAIRYRGDEFAAIIVNCNKDEAAQMAGNIRQSYLDMDLSALLKAQGIAIKVSIGVAMYPDDTTESEKLVSIAHGKMMHAREIGGGTIIV